ncbi:MAG: response regulator [Myxococcota bacterium]
MGEGGKRRVLVVDDDARVRRMACVALRHHGFDVVDAGDGASGLALARSAAPDLALVDIELGDMNGLALVAELRADPATARLPVLVMSGALVGGDERRGRDAPRAPGCGPLEYLAKPFGAADLVARIEGLLAAR